MRACACVCVRACMCVCLLTELHVAAGTVATEVPRVCPFGFVLHRVLTVGDLLTTFFHRVTLPVALECLAVAVVLQAKAQSSEKFCVSAQK